MIFNQISNSSRTPFTFVEFSNSESNTGSGVQPHKLLLIGQKLSSGTQAALLPARVTSEKQANTLFGAGSMLARMCIKALKANSTTETWAVPMADVVAGVAATGSVTFAGTATADGTISFYAGEKRILVAVTQGDSAADINADFIAAMTAVSDTGLNAVVDGTLSSKANITAKHKGLVYNGYPLKMNLNGESNPAGITVTIVPLAGGTTNPDITDALVAIGDEQFRSIVTPYLDAANLTAISSELSLRWGPNQINDGHAFAATNLDSSPAIALGLTRNSPHLTILSNALSPTPSFEAAAVLGATVAYNSPIDPARPLQRLPLVGIMAPKVEDRLILSERNTLLYSGIATTYVDAGGQVLIERLITTYREDAQGNVDESYLDYEKLAVLSYLRYDFRRFFGNRYPRHKLAKDGTRFGIGQAVMTPGLAKAECVGLFGNWEDLGLVEDSAAFEAGLVVEINALNPDRLDFYLPPNLIGALRILAAQIAFRS